MVNLNGKESVDKCFTEYMMLIAARNNKLEELETDLEDMNDTNMFTLADLKNRLEWFNIIIIDTGVIEIKVIKKERAENGNIIITYEKHPLYTGKRIKNVETGEIFESITSACFKYNMDKRNISKSIKNHWKCGGYHWEYVD